MMINDALALVDELDVHVVLVTLDGMTTIYGPFPTKKDAADWSTQHARSNRVALFHIGKVWHPDTKVILNG